MLKEKMLRTILRNQICIRLDCFLPGPSYSNSRNIFAVVESEKLPGIRQMTNTGEL